MTLVVNLFGGPGSGKSTTAAGVFSLLKQHGVNCELITEYAKELAWQGTLNNRRHEGYIFGKQAQRQQIPYGQTDIIITDSPLLLSIVYDKEANKHLENYVVSEFHRYNNINFFIVRDKLYNPKGRIQTEEEAKEIDSKVLNMLEDHGIPIEMIQGEHNTANIISHKILDSLNIPVRFWISKVYNIS